MSFLIIPLTLALILMLKSFQPVRGWWDSALKNPIISVLITLSFIATFLGGTALEASGGIAGTERILRLLVIIIIFFIALKSIAAKPQSFRNAGPSAKIMLLFGLVAMTSSLYSFDAIITIWKSIELLTVILAGFAIAGRIKSIATLNILMLIILFLVISAGLGALLTPQHAFANLQLSSSIVLRGTSPSINSNTLTQFAALLAVMLFTLRLYKVREYKNISTLVLIGISITIMLLGHSRTSIFSGILAIIMVFYFSKQRALLIIATGVGAIGFLVSDFLVQYITRGQSTEVFTSMSGRTNFWTEVWSYVVESPYIGYGYYAAQRELFYTSSIDNSYLEVLLGLGFIGLFVFVLHVVINGIMISQYIFKRNIPILQKIIVLQLATLYISLLVRSFTGPTFQILHPNLIMYMLLCISIPALLRLKTDSITKNTEPENIDPQDHTNSRILRYKTRGTHKQQ